MPASSSAWRARSASSGLTMKSRSWRVSGPPRAQIARLPPRSASTSASREAAIARFSVRSMAANESSATPGSYPVPRFRCRARGYGASMPVEANGRPAPRHDGESIRVAAAGDVHCSDANRDEIAAAFREVDGTVDLILLAGDLTTHGQPEQGRVLADACRDLETPIFTVLGNHDWH